MCLLIWTIFSGKRCGPWASCFIFCRMSSSFLYPLTWLIQSMIDWNHTSICQSIGFFSISTFKTVSHLFGSLKRYVFCCHNIDFEKVALKSHSSKTSCNVNSTSRCLIVILAIYMHINMHTKFVIDEYLT